MFNLDENEDHCFYKIAENYIIELKGCLNQDNEIAI
jgi:hypothetical protein